MGDHLRAIREVYGEPPADDQREVDSDDARTDEPGTQGKTRSDETGREKVFFVDDLHGMKHQTVSSGFCDTLPGHTCQLTKTPSKG